MTRIINSPERNKMTKNGIYMVMRKKAVASKETQYGAVLVGN